MSHVNCRIDGRSPIWIFERRQIAAFKYPDDPDYRNLYRFYGTPIPHHWLKPPQCKGFKKYLEKALDEWVIALRI